MKTLTALVAIVTLLGAAGGLWVYLDEKHAQREEMHAKFVAEEERHAKERSAAEIRFLEGELRRLDERIDDNNKLRHYYKDLQANGVLSGPDQRRNDYVIEALEGQYVRRRELKADIRALKAAK